MILEKIWVIDEEARHRELTNISQIIYVYIINNKVHKVDSYGTSQLKFIDMLQTVSDL